jgi:hypothetical protein
MHSNLTAANVAKYFGCPIIDNDGRVFTHCEIKPDALSLKVSNDGITYRYLKFAQCHILLKPIQEISGEHVAELGRLLDEANSHDGTSREWGIDRMDEMGIIIKDVNDQYAIGVLISNNCEIIGVDQYDLPRPIMKVNTIIDYLRKKGYDMDGFLTNNKAKK